MDKVEEVRNRKGYARWDEFQRALSLCRNVEDIVVATHTMIDAMNGYGSPKTSEMSKESLQQVIRDCRLSDYEVKYVDSSPDGEDLGEDK